MLIIHLYYITECVWKFANLLGYLHRLMSISRHEYKIYIIRIMLVAWVFTWNITKIKIEVNITRPPHFLLSMLMCHCLPPASISIHILPTMSLPATSPNNVSPCIKCPPWELIHFWCHQQCPPLWHWKMKHCNATLEMSPFLTSSAPPLCDISHFLML